jgi:hypothetical protein
MTTDVDCRRGSHETPAAWYARLDALYDEHLRGCDACNYDRLCQACEIGEEHGHSCNCGQADRTDGGLGTLLRRTREEAWRLSAGIRLDKRGQLELERSQHGHLTISYRSPHGRLELKIAATDVSDLFHLVGEDLIAEIDRWRGDAKRLLEIAGEYSLFMMGKSDAERAWFRRLRHELLGIQDREGTPFIHEHVVTTRPDQGRHRVDCRHCNWWSGDFPDAATAMRVGLEHVAQSERLGDR